MREPAAGVAQRLVWRTNRLRCMTHREIGHRVLRALAMHAERWRLLRSGAIPAPDLEQAPSPWIRVPGKLDARPSVQAAGRSAAGRFDVFALEDVKLGSPPRWNRDPKSGVEAPLTFGKLLDYRDARAVGDIKYLWE